MRVSRQLALPFGAARPRRRLRPAPVGVAHRARPLHCHRHPVHVTLRRGRLLPSMREQSLFLAIRRGLSRTARSWFRVLQFSVQTDHIHMIVEARDKPSLSRGLMGLLVRLARAFNRALGRRGSVWSERYHSRALKTPREVRNGLVYVLMNRHKHSAGGPAGLGLAVEQRARARSGAHETIRAFDVCSSAWWFDGWVTPPSSGPPVPTEGSPVAPPETWLARTGWKHHGLLRIDEYPKRRSRSRGRARAGRTRDRGVRRCRAAFRDSIEMS
jgi:putative transposase